MDVATSPAATVRLRGHEPVPARVELIRHSRRTRTTKALLTLVAAVVAAPIVFLLPPHVPWALGALVVGGYFAYRQWTGEYEVRSFAGSCPRCGAALPIEAGARIRLPHTVNCYQCHHEPTLVVDLPPE
jgi:hypothetical protein